MSTCSRCGRCCTYLAIITKAGTEDERRYYWLHGVKVIERAGSEWELRIPARCKMLKDKNECRAYARRPGVCRDWFCN